MNNHQYITYSPLLSSGGVRVALTHLSALCLILSVTTSFAQDSPVEATAEAASEDVTPPTSEPTPESTDGDPANETSTDESVEEPPTEEENPVVTEEADESVQESEGEQEKGSEDEPNAEEAATTEGSSAAAGEEKKKTPVRLELGGRTGYSMPIGDVEENSRLKDYAKFAIPIQFDAWARLGKLALGGYVKVAIGGKGEDLSDCSGCTPIDLALGGQLAIHGSPNGTVDPWFGLGGGIEMLTISGNTTYTGVTSGGDTITLDGTRTTTLTAIPEVFVQGGVEFGNESIRVGPFVNLSMSSFTKQKFEATCTDFRCPDSLNVSFDEKIPNQRFHSWLSFGIKGSYVMF